MTLNTIASGIDTSFSTKLNQNFQQNNLLGLTYKSKYPTIAYNDQTLTLTRGDVHVFSSWTQTSATVDFSGGSAGDKCIIIVEGNFTMSGGTIDASGQGYAGGVGATSLNGAAGTDSTIIGIGSSGGNPGLGTAAGNGTTFTDFSASDLPDEAAKMFNVIPGAGGGGGGRNSGAGGTPGDGGAGGTGGGGLVIIVFGALNFTGGTITVAGDNGSNGSNGSFGSAGGGGGGGGSGGYAILGYRTLTANSGTITVTGGTGGSGGTASSSSASGGGGAGGAGGPGSAGSNGLTGVNGDGSGGAGGAGGNGVSYAFSL